MLINPKFTFLYHQLALKVFYMISYEQSFENAKTVCVCVCVRGGRGGGAGYNTNLI